MAQACGVLYILTWKCASRHNGGHFFNISTSNSAPSMVCFVHVDFQMSFAPQGRALFHLSSGQLAAPAALASLLFDPPEPHIIGKTQCFRDFPTFSRAWIFFLLRLFSFVIFFFFSSLPFSDSSHFCFSSVHMIGSLTSKLPSMIVYVFAHLVLGSRSGGFTSATFFSQSKMSQSSLN